MLNELDIDAYAASQDIKDEVSKMKKLTLAIGGNDLTDQLTKAADSFDVRAYAKYVLREGSIERSGG